MRGHLPIIASLVYNAAVNHSAGALKGAAMVQFHRDWFNQMDFIQQEMNRLLDHFAGSKPPLVRFSPLVWEPNVDVYETKDNFIVIVELAGVKESDIRLTVDRDVFTIEGGRSKVRETSEKRIYHRIEIAGGPFKKSIRLPVAIDTKGIKASYEDGLVEVILPKAKTGGIIKVDIRTGLSTLRGEE